MNIVNLDYPKCLKNSKHNYVSPGALQLQRKHGGYVDIELSIKSNKYVAQKNISMY